MLPVTINMWLNQSILSIHLCGNTNANCWCKILNHWQASAPGKSRLRVNHIVQVAVSPRGKDHRMNFPLRINWSGSVFFDDYISFNSNGSKKGKKSSFVAKVIEDDWLILYDETNSSGGNSELNMKLFLAVRTASCQGITHFCKSVGLYKTCFCSLDMNCSPLNKMWEKGYWAIFLQQVAPSGRAEWRWGCWNNWVYITLLLLGSRLVEIATENFLLISVSVRDQTDC